MTEPLSFEEWKEKSHISTVEILENIAREHSKISDSVKDHLDEFLKKDYKLYLYQVKNPDWYEVLKDTSGEVRGIRDDWEAVIDSLESGN